MPAIVNIGYGHSFGYTPCPYGNANDTVNFIMHWGDGTDTSFYEVYPTTFCYFNGQVSHTYTVPGTHTAILVVDPDSASDSIHISFNIRPDCITFDGFAYLDENENCIYDNGDEVRTNLPLSFKDSNDVPYLGFCDSTGHFTLSIPESIGPVVNRSPLQGLMRICPNSADLTFSTNADTTIEMGFECHNNDINEIMTMHGPRVGVPGELGGVDLTIYSSGCEGRVKQVSLEWEPLLSYEGSAGTPPDSILDNVAYWNPVFGSFNGGGTYMDKFYTGRLRFRTDTSAYMDQPTTMRATVTYTNDETDSTDNFIVRTHKVGVPVDPNNKIVDPVGVGPTGRVPPGTRFTYRINFQNTGTAPARHVKILDTLPEFLDPSTIEILGSKHYMETSYYRGGVLRFDFPDINLPDSNANEPESHGWLTFRISPKDVPLGTVIKNRVGIYFDYQPPVITNYAINTIDTFPNRLEATVITQNMTCNDDSNGTATVQVTNGNGQYTYAWSTGESTAQISELGPGTYTVTITDRADSVEIVSAEILHTPTHPDPTIGEFSGPMQVGAWQPYVYTLQPQPNQSYAWNAHSGEVLESTANNAQVLWHAGPEGWLYVTQTNEFGCKATDSTSVDILFVGQDELSEESIIVFPNPAKDRLFIQGLPSQGNVHLRVSDMQGRTVIDQSKPSTSPWIEVGQLHSGSYTISIEPDGGSDVSFPFVKE